MPTVISTTDFWWSREFERDPERAWLAHGSEILRARIAEHGIDEVAAWVTKTPGAIDLVSALPAARAKKTTRHAPAKCAACGAPLTRGWSWAHGRGGGRYTCLGGECAATRDGSSSRSTSPRTTTPPAWRLPEHTPRRTPRLPTPIPIPASRRDPRIVEIPDYMIDTIRDEIWRYAPAGRGDDFSEAGGWLYGRVERGRWRVLEMEPWTTTRTRRSITIPDFRNTFPPPHPSRGLVEIGVWHSHPPNRDEGHVPGLSVNDERAVELLRAEGWGQENPGAGLLSLLAWSTGDSWGHTRFSGWLHRDQQKPTEPVHVLEPVLINPKEKQ